MVADCWKLQAKKEAEGTAAVNEDECQEQEHDQEDPKVSGIFSVNQKSKKYSKNQ